MDDLSAYVVEILSGENGFDSTTQADSCQSDVRPLTVHMAKGGNRLSTSREAPSSVTFAKAAFMVNAAIV
jgi:hypothetical protein